MGLNGLWVSAFAIGFPLGVALAYDDDAQDEQRNADRTQNRQVVDDYSDAQQVLSRGDSVTRQVNDPDAFLKGRARHVFQSWKRRGWRPQVFEVSRGGSPTLLLTGHYRNGGIKYAYFHMPASNP